jgi:transcriptional regulator with XRE-family HTH domain/mannose-6-phosphate isomerase-like protein (cupin superfamily)
LNRIVKEESVDLGHYLKTLRQERRLTLVQLGDQVGLSASYLSQVERGVTTPSLLRVADLARVLGVDVHTFFQEDVTPPTVVRCHQGRPLLQTPDVSVELLSPDFSQKEIEPYCLVCQPGAARDPLPRHPGEEFGFVLQGQLTVTVGEEQFLLDAGDSIHFQGAQPHAWRNEGEIECVVMWAISPPLPDGQGMWNTPDAAPDGERG